MNVSLYNKLTDKEGTNVEITSILQDIQSGKYEYDVNRIRQAKTKQERNEFKILLPAFTASGIFNGSRTEKSLLKHSGLIQIDIDNDYAAIGNKRQIYSDKFIYSGFISPSGNGLKLIVKIPPDREKHKVYFNSFCDYLNSNYHIKADRSVKDTSRLMFVSYDPELYLNDNSEVFTETGTESKNNERLTAKGKSTGNHHDKKSEDVERIISEIENKHLDITSSYENWLKIGFAFSSYFGEAGRSLFHRVSRFNQDYSPKDADEQYNKCINSNHGGVNIESFFFYAKQFGMDISPGKKEIKKPAEIIGKDNLSKYAKVEKYLSEIYDFRYNEISNTIEFRAKGEKAYKEVNEHNIYRMLQHNSIPFSLDNLKSLLRSDFIPVFNPFDEYFNELPSWREGDPDYISLFANYIRAKDQERFNLHFRKMFVRSVACALDNEYFNKHVFILVHDKQNSGKTTLCRWICPPGLQNYYSENISTDKDSLISLAENLIINLDELSTLNKAEINALKSIISKQNVKIRRPYDSRPVLMPRRCNFIGSTNKDEFLTDETGSVRWLCFEIDGINWDYKQNIDINLVWAQAFALYKTGFKYDLTIEEIEKNEEVNKHFRIESDEMQFIMKHFEPSEKSVGNFYTTSSICDFLNTRYPYLKTNANRVGKAMKMIGFQRNGQEYIGKFQVKGFYLLENAV